MPPFKEGTQQSYIHWQLANWLPMHVAMVNPGIGQLCLGGPASYGSLTVKTIDKNKYRFLYSSSANQLILVLDTQHNQNHIFGWQQQGQKSVPCLI